MESLGEQWTSAFYRRWGKRALDLTMGAAGLLFLFPLFMAVSIIVWKSVGPPIYFRQFRPGLKGKPFRIIKFRTMKELREPNGGLLPDGKRLTAAGRFLRNHSLDELPEMVNVIKGDMSLVGPRPLLPQYLGRYTAEQARRHEVKPGITGWAQVNGRNAITWEEKFALDVWYVDNQSFWLDMKILAMTAWKVLRREGISAEGEATMPEFMGTVSSTGKSENA